MRFSSPTPSRSQAGADYGHESHGPPILGLKTATTGSRPHVRGYDNGGRRLHQHRRRSVSFSNLRRQSRLGLSLLFFWEGGGPGRGGHLTTYPGRFARGLRARVSTPLVTEDAASCRYRAEARPRIQARQGPPISQRPGATHELGNAAGLRPLQDRDRGAPTVARKRREELPTACEASAVDLAPSPAAGPYARHVRRRGRSVSFRRCTTGTDPELQP